ncbi:MAG: hypothetical protein JXB62_11545 [Pirellulales bacterium]|nr:hypothetical protein [Pirellulales bacterium]
MRAICRLGLWWTCLLLAGLYGPVATAAGDSAPVPPRPEDYFDSGRTPEYIRQAKQFLVEHPRAEAAPRVTFELLMAATVANDAKLADEAKGGLVMQYPTSLYTQYLLSTFPNPADYRKLLTGLLKDRDDVFSGDFAKPYCRAAELGVKRWGDSFLSDDTFLLQGALMARAAGDYRLELLCLPKLARCKDPTQRIAQIGFSSTEDDVTKIAELSEILDNPTARLYERFFYGRLSDQQRASREIVRIVAKNHLAASEFSEALPLIEKLAGDDDPQMLFWLGWCRATLGQTDQSLDVLDGLCRKHPQSPWSGQAKDLAQRVRQQQANLDQCADALLRVTSKARQHEMGAIEGTVAFRRDDGRELSLYLALIPERGHLELVLHQAGEILLGYQTTDRKSKLFFAGEPAIDVFDQKAFYPSPQFSLTRDENGKFNFNGGLQITGSPEGISEVGQTVLDSPFLATKPGLLMLLTGVTAKGWLPEPAATTEAGRQFRWVRPAVTRPDVDCWQCVVTSEEKLCSLRVGPVTCTQLRYGPSDAFELAPPPWPDLPVVRKEKMDPAALFRMMGVAASLLNRQDNAEATAGRAEPTRR